MTTKKDTYRTLKAQLDEILDTLQGGHVDIEEATELYAEAEQIVDKLNSLISKAENRVSKIKKPN